jgi:hypothetical protein
VGTVDVCMECETFELSRGPLSLRLQVGAVSEIQTLLARSLEAYANRPSGLGHEDPAETGSQTEARIFERLAAFHGKGKA